MLHQFFNNITDGNSLNKNFRFSQTYDYSKSFNSMLKVYQMRLFLSKSRNNAVPMGTAAVIRPVSKTMDLDRLPDVSTGARG